MNLLAYLEIPVLLLKLLASIELKFVSNSFPSNPWGFAGLFCCPAAAAVAGIESNPDNPA